MTKSTTIVFILFFSILFKLEKKVSFEASPQESRTKHCFFAVVEPGNNCSDDNSRSDPLHVQVDPIQFLRIYPAVNCVDFKRLEMDVYATVAAEIQTWYEQSHRHDLLHAALDDCGCFANCTLHGRYRKLHAYNFMYNISFNTLVII